MPRCPLPLVLVAILALAGCPKRSPTHALELAVRSVKEGALAPRNLALAGWAAYLLHSKPDEAAPFFEKAAKTGDPWALWGQAELARRRLDTRGRVLASLKLCASAPAHPLCAVAARVALGATGESPALDSEIETGALAALSAGAPGDAAFLLRHAIASVRRNRGDRAGASSSLADAGILTRASILGPYSRNHFLEWDTAFPPESGQPGTGPLGPIAPREARSFDGRFVLWAEPTTADVWYWSVDVDVPADAVHLIRAVGKGTLKVFVDGTPALERRDFEAWLPEELAAEAFLSAGRHRVLIKFARGTERGDVALSLPRLDGRPAALAVSAASGPFEPAHVRVRETELAWPGAAALESALEEEAGAALASFVAVRDASERDGTASRTMALGLAGAAPSSPLLVLRAEAGLSDHSLPTRVARGVADRDLEDAVRLDPGEATALQRLSVHARLESRFEDAERWLERARTASSGFRLLLTEMKLAQSRGVEAMAEDAARRALAAEPGLCDAAELRYDIARRFDDVATSDSMMELLSRCPGNLRRKAEHLRVRGDQAGALAAWRQLASESWDPNPGQSAAATLLALGRAAESAAAWSELERDWPRASAYPKKRAEALERAGEVKAARAAKERALLLDGSDLKLRRALAAEDGHEVLDELAVDGRAELARYASEAPAESASGVYVLDADAVEGHPDGSYTERTHLVAKVLDQRGISLLAEVHIPAGADILLLRTLKQDGRALEPESIAGKEGISMPGVEVGDAIEYEYLASHGAAGAATPGFSTPKFYFRIADGQLDHSVFDVRAPAGTGLEVDAHGMEAPKVVREGGWESLHAERRRVPSFVREPGAPASEELVPFVQAGAGAGSDEALAALADFLLDRARVTPDVERFAREAAGGLGGEEAARAVYAKVMQEVKGAEASLTTRAAITLAEGRGSRIVLLKAALGALGMHARYVLVRPFGTDPAAYRFPYAERYAFAALRLELPAGEVLLNPGVRWAPFGKVAPQAQGQDAVVLPEPGEKLFHFTTPGNGEADGKKVKLKLALAADGTLSGSGEEEYQGLDAAYSRTGLERLSQDQRKQAIEAAIARTFDNAILEDFGVEEKEEPGAPLFIRYRFRAPGFARVEAGRLVVGQGFYQANLAQRFVVLAKRETPLVIGTPERMQLSAEIALPPGMAPVSPPPVARLDTPFGVWERTEALVSPPLLPAPAGSEAKKEGARLTIEERLELRMTRVAPEKYGELASFAAAVDKGQEREWILSRMAGGPR